MYTGRQLPDPQMINPGEKFRKFLGLGSKTYRDIKLAYRQGGMKRSMPCYAGAKELTASIRSSGAEVWVTTSRPYLQLGNVDADTRHWLRRNGIQYDNILWGENKYRDLAKIAGARVVGVLEDLPEMRLQAQAHGLTVFFRTQPYNVHVNCYPFRVDDLFQAQEMMLDALRHYKAQAGAQDRRLTSGLDRP